MSDDEDSATEFCVPPLVELCQRVAATHVESYCSLGDNMPLVLAQPILQHCSPEALLRFEQATPSLANVTADLWKALCFRSYPLAAEQRNADAEPESWREEFFILRELEVQRLEAVGSKLRNQREELEQRKKDSQIKFTDKVPPTKRFRGTWGQPQPPRTLLQKTIAHSAKLQKGIYGSRMAPTMPVSKSFRSLATGSSNATATSPPPSSSIPATPSKSGTRIIVSSIPKAPRPVLLKDQPSSSSTPASARPHPTPASSSNTTSPSKNPPAIDTPRPIQGSPPPNVTRTGTLRTPAARKDPMTSLFMPKHRAYSQLPTQSTAMRSRT